jgi:hypothetical protein
MTVRVFISYSHRDLDRDWLHSFANALQDRDINVWLDEWNIRPGDQIAEKVETALSASDAVERPNVYLELGMALGANKRLILVVDKSSANRLPFALRQRRWVLMQTPTETALEVAEAIDPPD